MNTQIIVNLSDFDDFRHFAKWLATMTGKTPEWIETFCYGDFAKLEKYGEVDFTGRIASLKS